MKYPFQFIPDRIRKPIFIKLLGWTILLLVVLQFLNIPLQTTEAPIGIISHQFAWTPVKAQLIISSWSDHAHLMAAFDIGLDFLFMASYTLTLSLGILLASRYFPDNFSRFGNLAAYGVLAAAFLDAIENIGQANQILVGNVSFQSTILVGVSATLKFTFLLIGIFYAFIGWYRSFIFKKE
jgi:hypothetical protein